LKLVPNSHTGEIINIVRNWNIEKKVIIATIDGASKANLAIDILPYLDKLRCLTHVLNLLTKNILDKNVSPNISDIVKKCRSLVCTFKHSNLLSEQLKKAMECRRNNAQEFV
jgi:hypothetical protein